MTNPFNFPFFPVPTLDKSRDFHFPEPQEPVEETADKTTKFVCHMEGCQREYQWKCDLKAHISRHHGAEALRSRIDLPGRQADVVDRRFHCQQCLSKFKNLKDLTKHSKLKHGQQSLTKAVQRE